MNGFCIHEKENISSKSWEVDQNGFFSNWHFSHPDAFHVSDLLIRKVHGAGAGISRRWLRGFDMSGVILCCGFCVAVHTASPWCLCISFILVMCDDWRGREGGDVLIKDWNLKLQSFNLNSLSVSSFFSCYLFNFCHWCKRGEKKEIWKDARCWFLSGWRITEVQDKMEFAVSHSDRLRKIKHLSTTTVCLPLAIAELLRQWHLSIVGTFCQDCSI